MQAGYLSISSHLSTEKKIEKGDDAFVEKSCEEQEDSYTAVKNLIL